MPDAVIYARISQDRTGEMAGVKRQEADCRDLADRLGWTVAEVFVDDDVSAYSGRVRPGYQSMCEAIDTGRADAILTWHPDRLHRHPMDLEGFIQLVERTKAKVATVQAGEFDLSTSTGRMQARIVGTVARHEAEHKAERQQRKHVELAEQGKPSGGGRRPFGYEADKVTVNKSEAKLIRKAVELVLAGGSLHSIVREWNAAGHTTTTGSPWQRTTLRRILISRRIAGIREHNGQVAGKAVWPAIITPEQSEAVRAILIDPARTIDGIRNPTYLLAGLIRCGDCGTKMSAHPTGGVRRYHCSVVKGGCNKVGINAEKVEELVVAAVRLRLEGQPLAAALANNGTDDDTSAEIADLTTRLEGLSRDHYVDRIITRDEFIAARGPLQAELDALKAQRGRAAIEHSFSDVAGDFDAVWGTLDFDRRKALLRVVLDAVVVARTDKRTNRFDPDRVELDYAA